MDSSDDDSDSDGSSDFEFAIEGAVKKKEVFKDDIDSSSDVYGSSSSSDSPKRSKKSKNSKIRRKSARSGRFVKILTISFSNQNFRH